jgi:ketosteroid isomerase-like protein
MEATTAPNTEAALQALQDRNEITDVLYKYAATIDKFDYEGLRTTLADDIWAQYGNGDPVEGGDALQQWIREMTDTVIWQHHLLSVYSVEIDGDSAKSLVYHTSHQLFEDDADNVKLLVGRYHNELRRDGNGWRISRLVLEILWGESKADSAGYLELVGGRGPQV